MFDARLNLFRQILRAERIAGAKENEKIKLLKFNDRVDVAQNRRRASRKKPRNVIKEFLFRPHVQ